MRKTVEQIKCDLCGKNITVPNSSIKYPVIFTTDQTEGCRCKPYISVESLDFCDECRTKVLMVTGEGAQGHNDYKLIEEKKV